MMVISGCKVTGSSLSVEDKNVVNSPEASEQVNVYPLTASFVAQYNASASDQSLAQTNTELDTKISNYEYKVGTGDILNITIWDHPELTIPAGSYRSTKDAGHWVHADGKIFYPYIGFVYVEGKTVSQIRDVIATKLVKYIESPQVDVNLAGFRSQKVYVTGEVKNQGQQAITNVPLTLLDAINKSGGVTLEADWHNVSLTRGGQTEVVSLYNLMQKGDLTENRLMQAGDIIHVPRNDIQKVFVLGEVKESSMLKMDRSGMTLTEALASAGGINEISADATGIFVIRSAARDLDREAFLNKTKQNSSVELTAELTTVANIYQLDINDASALMIGTEFELAPYDVVYVTASPVGLWNRVIMQLMPTINGLNRLAEGALRIKNWP